MIRRTIKLYIRKDLRGAHAWPFIYFDCAVERYVDRRCNSRRRTPRVGYRWCAPDLISASIPLEEAPPGVTRVEACGRPAFLFLWVMRSEYSTGPPQRRGYVVFADDKDAVRRARRSMHSGAGW
jgi:hypothetical protein